MTTVNHDRWHREHIRRLATDATPARPLWLRPRRRRTDWLGALASIVAMAVIVGAITFAILVLANTAL